jgi:hypothetical protein
LEVLFDDTRVVKWNKLPKATCAGVTGSLLPLEANLRDDMIANAAVALIGIGLLAIGAIAIAAPETAALMFGVPTQTTEARAYVWATATRDVAIGCWFLVLLALRVSRQALSASLIVIALIPIGDFVNVYSNAGQSTTALLLHGGSSVVFLAFGGWLWRTDLSR